MELPQVQLDYAPALPWHRRRIARRWMLVGLAAIAVGCGLWWRQALWYQVQVRYCQWRCEWAVSPGQLVFTNVPGDVAKLSQDPRYQMVQVFGEQAVELKAPDCWKEWRRLTGLNVSIGQDGGLVFFHRLRNGQGQARVVVVPWGGRRAITFKQEGMLAKASVAKLQCPGPAYRLVDEHRKQVRVFGGQVDAADSSRFSFRFEVDGKSGWMDLRLQDGDLVKYEIRRPPGAPTGKG